LKKNVIEDKLKRLKESPYSAKELICPPSPPSQHKK